MPITKPKLSKEDVSVEIDLKELGLSKLGSAQRDVFFQLAFDKMMDRLEQGRGVKGNLMPYSKAYKESLAYQAFGKDGTVNMQLTGDMINSVKEQKSKDKTKLKIGFDGDDNNIKAFAHMTGYKGHPTLDGKVKPREFFGWTDKELKDIAKEFKVESPATERQLISDAKILSILDRLTKDG